jgi:2-keto-4-pentenoate hydratase
MPNLSAADFLADLRAHPRRIAGLPTDLQPTDLASAYAIQDGLVDRLLARHGGQRIGYKTACTNELAQRQLNIAGPLFGQLLSCSTERSPGRFSAGGHLVRIIELEFGVQMAHDALPQSTPYDAQSIRPFVGALLPGIEIVSHRFVDWTQAGALGLAADNAIHGAWVHGDHYTDWRELNLAEHEATLSVNGAIVRRGTGANVLGHPLNVIAWLANELPVYGKMLRAGDFITTGVICDVYLAEAGDVIRGDFGVIGAVELTVTE